MNLAHTTTRAKWAALMAPLAIATLAIAACGSPEEPMAEPEPDPVTLSSCPDLIEAPEGAPFFINDIWCAQEFIGTPESFLADTIEASIADFNQTADLMEDEIIMIELAFFGQNAAGTQIQLSGQDSAFKLIHQDGTTSVPTSWVQVNDPLRDLESLGDDPGEAFINDTFGGITRSLLGQTIRETAAALEDKTEPLTVNDDVLVWVPYIFKMDNPAVSVDYNGTIIPLTYSPIN